MNYCPKVHRIFNALERHSFSFKEEKIPLNGIYILFEKDERGHGYDRIVRIGTHTGDNQLRSRLKQHFSNENKDRSIFRKNIGRALLKKNNDPFCKGWELDLTSRKNRERYSDKVDFSKQNETEKKVTEYIQNNIAFVVFEVVDKGIRLSLESKIISTVSLCSKCQSSVNWLGLYSPKRKIQESGLWLVNKLYKAPLSEIDMDTLNKIL